MSGDRWADVWFLLGVAVSVVAIIAWMAWAGDRRVTRGRR